MKKLLLVLTVVVAVGVAVPLALAANDYNGTAPLVHVGLNPATCGTVAGTDSGVVNVHYNVVQNGFMVNLTVRGALPKTEYVLDVRCWTFGPQSELGTLTTNSQGTGTAHFTLPDTAPINPFYIDISVKGGGGGSGNYGDTFIAGPFTLG